jgi:hypothetical protein
VGLGELSEAKRRDFLAALRVRFGVMVMVMVMVMLRNPDKPASSDTMVLAIQMTPPE